MADDRLLNTWSRSDTISFIELLKEYPSLWQVKNPDYAKRGKRSNSLALMTSRLQQLKPGVTVETVRKKINILRTQFRKELKMLEASKKSGAGTADVYIPSLWSFSLLQFLACGDLMETPQSTLNLGVLQSENEDMQLQIDEEFHQLAEEVGIDLPDIPTVTLTQEEYEECVSDTSLSHQLLPSPHRPTPGPCHQPSCLPSTSFHPASSSTLPLLSPTFSLPSATVSLPSTSLPSTLSMSSFPFSTPSTLPVTLPSLNSLPSSSSAPPSKRRKTEKKNSTLMMDAVMESLKKVDAEPQPDCYSIFANELAESLRLADSKEQFSIARIIMQYYSYLALNNRLTHSMVEDVMKHK